MIQLRAILPEDKPHIIRLMNNEQLSRFMSDRVPYPYTEKNADAFYEVIKNSPNDHFFAITLDSEFIGGLGLHAQPLNNSHTVEIGYWIGEPWHGKGFATEAVKLGLEKAFKLPEIKKVFAKVFEGNIASEKVLLKNGFALEGVLSKHSMKRGVLLDEKIYGKLSPELSANAKSK